MFLIVPFIPERIDNVTVDEICKTTFLKTGYQVFEAPIELRGNTVIKNRLHINGTINGIRLDDFRRRCVMVDQPAVIRGVKHFKTLVVEGPMVVNRSVSGIDFGYIANNYMSLTKDQLIKTPLTFNGDVIFDRDLLVKGS